MNIKNDNLSYIGMQSHDNLKYPKEYWKAFSTLYDSREPIDTVALPMMFSIRH